MLLSNQRIVSRLILELKKGVPKHPFPERNVPGGD